MSTCHKESGFAEEEGAVSHDVCCWKVGSSDVAGVAAVNVTVTEVVNSVPSIALPRATQMFHRRTRWGLSHGLFGAMNWLQHQV